MSNIETMSLEDIDLRAKEIETEREKDDADLDALLEETRALIDRKNILIDERKAAAAAVINGAGEEIEKPKERNMMEIRNSKDYIDAYARYIISGDDRECRALTTENVSGSVPVPEMVDEIVRTAWDRDELLSRVRKTYFPGNVKVGFEAAADGAYAHTEGTTAITEESLTLGIVTMVPKNIKKYIKVSDEVVSIGIGGGERFLRYIYDELTHQIIKKLADLCVADIATASATNSTSAVGVPRVTAAPGVTTIAQAFAQLSDEAANPVIIINKLTYADFVTAAAAGNFAIDWTMGLPVIFNNSLSAYTAASGGGVYACVGDLSGIQVNYPEGENVVIKYDDLTEAEADMVKIVGRQYAAHALTAPGRFVNILKPSGT